MRHRYTTQGTRKNTNKENKGFYTGAIPHFNNKVFPRNVQSKHTLSPSAKSKVSLFLCAPEHLSLLAFNPSSLMMNRVSAEKRGHSNLKGQSISGATSTGTTKSFFNTLESMLTILYPAKEDFGAG